MIRLKGLKIDALEEQTNALRKKISKILAIPSCDIYEININKQSLDARHKEQIFYVYDVDIKVECEKKLLSQGFEITPDENYILPKYKKADLIQPIIVGCGPAGLFAAFIMIECGIKPTILERGEKMEERIQTVETFFKTGKLNTESNIQFGEGGAGTFSDGKLNTLKKDHHFRGKKVLETFVRFGAPEEILYSFKPHIGTDILRNVIKNMRNYIQEQGGIFLYNTCLTDLVIKNKRIVEIEVNHKEKIRTNTLILAIGHSARDTFKMLHERGLKLEAKPFAVGFRIEHLQEDINRSQYGEKYAKLLKPANYKLTYQSSNGHGVYSFCMCPGGYVVNASSEEKRLVVNGMSYYNRDSKNANSALVITVNEKIYGSSLFAGMEFQRKLEEDAYHLGNGKIPIQLLGDYMMNKNSSKLQSIIPETKGDYICTNLNELLPTELNIALKEAIPYFDKKIKGFYDKDAILSGVETRSSSPIRILRNEHYYSNIKGIYPIGEGAGYAGGIMTSAIDGIKLAEELINNIEGE